MNNPRNWFGPKRIGFGYSPRTWEGWSLMGALFVIGALAKHFVT